MQLTTDPPGALRRAHRRARPGQPTAGSSSAPARAPARPSSSRSASPMARSARIWEDAIRASSRCSRTAAASITASSSTCRCATCCRSRCKSRTRRSGSPARSWRRSRWRAGAALARWGSSSCRPTRRLPGCTPTTTRSPSGRRSWPTTRPTRTSRWSAISCAPRPTRRRAAAPTAPRSSSSRCASTVRARPASGRCRARSTCGTSTRSGSARTRRRLARALSGGLIGSPETIRRKLRRFETSNIDQVILLNQAGKNTHEHICESLDLFAREVMPEFHANDPGTRTPGRPRCWPARSSSRRSTPRRSATATAPIRCSSAPVAAE